MSITAWLDSRRRIVLVALVLVAGCDSKSPASGPVESAAARGELLSYACQACHSLARDQAHVIGPNLSGVFGREAGTVEGFDFSAALRESGLVWTPELLDEWLADPGGFLPGTTMAFTGYQSADDRSALIDYLLEATEP